MVEAVEQFATLTIKLKSSHKVENSHKKTSIFHNKWSDKIN